MELRRWILDDHEGIGTRFRNTVAAHVPVERWREQPGGGSSIAGLLLHTAWHEDVAMSTVVGGEKPLRPSWEAELGLDGVDAHAGLGETEDAELTARLDLTALATYWDAVRNRTRSWLSTCDLAELDDVPPVATRLEELADVRADVVPWLHRMWADKPVSFFVQWEAIGHQHGHLGEMIAVRSRLGLSPF